MICWETFERVAIDKLKGGVHFSRMEFRVVGEFYEWQLVCPVCRVLGAVDSKVSFYFLVEAFSGAI